MLCIHLPYLHLLCRAQESPTDSRMGRALFTRPASSAYLPDSRVQVLVVPPAMGSEIWVRSWRIVVMIRERSRRYAFYLIMTISLCMIRSCFCLYCFNYYYSRRPLIKYHYYCAFVLYRMSSHHPIRRNLL